MFHVKHSALLKFILHQHDAIQGIIPLSPAWMIPEGARKGPLLGQTFDPDHIPELTYEQFLELVSTI